MHLHVSPMIRSRGIAFTLGLCILSSCTVIFAVIFGYNYVVSRRLITQKIEENARNLVLRTANRIETVLQSVEKVPDTLAVSLEHASYTREEILGLLRSVVEGTPAIYGSTISFEPHLFDRGSRCFGPYYYKRGGRLEFAWLDEKYDYFKWDWYTLPKKTGRHVWTGPYYDEGGGNIIMATYSVPFFLTVGGKRRFAGVVTADVHLSWLEEIVAGIKIEETGYAFLIAGDSTIVTHPQKYLIMKEKLLNLAEARHDAQLEKIAREMMGGGSGFLPSSSIVTRRPVWIGFEPIPSTGWSLGVSFPRDELMADVTRLSRTVFVLGLAGFAILLGVIAAISGTITRPLRALAAATRGIATGGLDFTLPPAPPGGEVGGLAAALVYMRDALKKHIRELTEATAARERMESELAIARRIQMEMVPKEIPPFPGRDEFDIRAILEPAREVGGDLYDFFFLDEEHLCIVVGDVSGKGVPAALFMARTITFIKATAHEAKSPDEILSRVNRELSRHNESCMFVTVFCGIVDVSTGEFTYTNAGHNPPLIARQGAPAGFLAGGQGTVLGIEENAVFTKETTVLRPGDILCLYTDGVTEAFDGKGEMYSEERLTEEVSAHAGDSAAELAEDTMRKVRAHAAGAPQSDDITIVVCRYQHVAGSVAIPLQHTVTLWNRLSEIPALGREIAAFGKKHRLAEDALFDARLSLEEVVVNIVRYAYRDAGEHEITVRLIVRAGELVLEVRDDGRPFNPLEVPSPDLRKPLEEREAGGMGVFLARSVMDSVEYRRDGGENVLVMRKKLSRA